MEHIYIIGAFLEQNGFEVIQKNESENFGNYIAVYSNGSIFFRILLDKSQLSIEI